MLDHTRMAILLSHKPQVLTWLVRMYKNRSFKSLMNFDNQTRTYHPILSFFASLRMTGSDLATTGFDGKGASGRIQRYYEETSHFV